MRSFILAALFPLLWMPPAEAAGLLRSRSVTRVKVKEVQQVNVKQVKVVQQVQVQKVVQQVNVVKQVQAVYTPAYIVQPAQAYFAVRSYAYAAPVAYSMSYGCPASVQSYSYGQTQVLNPAVQALQQAQTAPPGSTVVVDPSGKVTIVPPAPMQKAP